MSDDFERAVLITFNFTGTVDAEIKERATSFVNEIKNSPECWRLCIERFSVTAYAEVKFWCLQTLHELIRAGYSALPRATKAAIKTALLTWLQRDCNIPQMPLAPFLRNKLAQTLVSVLQVEYPSEWPSFFQDLIRAMSQGEGVIDMFCRILVSVDEDLVSLDIPRSQDESKLSMHIKDSMREHSISDVAAAWYQLVDAYKAKDPELAATVLQTMQRYIGWIDINLVANDKFIGLLEALLDASNASLQGAAVDCLTEIVSKRMDAVPKLTLIQNMNIVPRCAVWANGFPVSLDDNEELLVKFARLLATLATEIMDSLKRVENGVISLTAVGINVDDEAAREAAAASEVANTLLEALFPALMSAFKSDVDEVSLPLLPFMVAYVARLKTLHKRNNALSADALLHIRAILGGLSVSARYPSDSALRSSAMGSAAELSAAQEEQSEVEEKRRDLFTLFKNIAKIAFSETLTFVGSLLQNVISRPNAPFEDVEIAVLLLYELGEGAPEEALKPDSGSLGALVVALMQASVPAAHNKLVALAVLETYVRYAKVLQQHQHAIPGAIMTFLDERGMGHPAEDVANRACYLFCRLVKVLRSNLRPYLATILNSLQPHLVRVATTPLSEGASSAGSSRDAAKAAAPGTALVDDRLYIFEAVGLLLGQEELSVQDQQSMLNVLLQPLLKQIEDNLQGQSQLPASPGLILQALEAVMRLSKGFKTDLCTRTRPQIGRMFIQCLEVAIQVPRMYPMHKLLRARFISCVHRLVECLTNMLLPYLPMALEVLVTTQADALDLIDVLSLLNQLMVRFKTLLQNLLESILPVVIGRIHTVLNASWDWSGKLASPGTMTSGSGSGAGASAAAADQAVSATLEDAREKGELQRAYYALLHTVTSNGMSSALLKAPPAAVDAVMMALTQGAATHVDAAVRRTCVQVFERLLTDWCASGGNGAAEVVPGFRRFAMEKLGGDACVMGLLRSNLDARDVGTQALLTEIATALKLVYEKCGDEFAAHLLSVVLPSVGFPQPAQQQLVYHLREVDAKNLKDFLKAVLHQQALSNGVK